MSESTTNEVVEEVEVVAPGQETDPVAALTADLNACRQSMQTTKSV